MEQSCVSLFEQEWDLFLNRLRELQAEESFIRLELSTIVSQMDICLSKLNAVLLQKGQLVRAQPVRTQPFVDLVDPSANVSLPAEVGGVQILELVEDSSNW
jgi:hypothetical protein